MTVLFILQLLVPLVFVVWMAVAPPRNTLGFFLQLAATAAAGVAIALTGLWLFPPWWTPFAFGVLLFLAGLYGWRRRPFASTLPKTGRAWAGACLFLALGGVALWQASLAGLGRTPPAEQVVDLAFPLGHGTYLVANGGYAAGINAHLKTLDPAVPRFEAWRGQSYGVDLVKINTAGLRASGVQPPEPDAYLIYGARVLAPCDGEVLLAVDGLPDLQVPQTDRVNLAGNHVMLRCAGAHVLLGHLIPGSVKVGVGARVRVGEAVGRVGNSGNTSEPHLHIHAQRPGSALEPLSGDPLPIRFNGRQLMRNDRVTVP